MFTGIVTDVGEVRALEKAGGAKLVLSVPFATDKVAIGASVCCAGACLTVTEKGPDWLAFDASEETLRRTTIGGWKPGTPVNLERSLKAGDELGGHVVMGHVDAVSEVRDVKSAGNADIFTFSLPKNIAHLVAEKGSIAVDGVSLTVNAVAGDEFSVAVIPHSKAVTAFKSLKKGDKVNVEADIFARYSARLQEVKD